jgi:hypothetical protein
MRKEKQEFFYLAYDSVEDLPGTDAALLKKAKKQLEMRMHPTHTSMLVRQQN